MLQLEYVYFCGKFTPRMTQNTVPVAPAQNQRSSQNKGAFSDAKKGPIKRDDTSAN